MSRILIAALIAALAWGGLQWGRAKSWEAEALASASRASAYQLSADGCAERVKDISKDKESDDAIDAISDRDLRNVPEHWMR